MVDAPERIWTSQDGTWLTNESPSQTEATEYVRADLYEQARKALGMMLREHDILSGNFGDVADPKHRRPDRWPTAAEAARRAREGGNADG